MEVKLKHFEKAERPDKSMPLTKMSILTVGLTAFVKLGFSQKNFIVSKVGGGQVV